MRTPITTKTTTSPCVRGTCYIDSDNDQSIFCLCPSGFTGRHCEMGSGNNPTFFCLCPSDFTGHHCETRGRQYHAHTTGHSGHTPSCVARPEGLKRNIVFAASDNFNTTWEIPDVQPDNDQQQ
ncbi:hypothetical protein DPMN_167278 [Dreissena polymorpha]|uniref:EGF-like domain-containing protein n=1 Tax=Dreissena polymorpha TaxID=45954 RepID=A0A9D4IY71_DREPO|nr:hypothetical protein DPMN_167278 [Dreissena polymorpha]